MSRYFSKLSLRRLWEQSSALVVRGVLHLIGIACVFSLSALFLLPAQSRGALREAYQEGFFGAIPFEVLLHLGLSACVWAMGCIVWHLVSLRARQKKPRLVRARGTVITETIIVFPVFLLLTMGLIQLTLLNSAGLLTSLASFKAARAVAVWHPEAVIERNGVDGEVVYHKARLAAAGAVAPVAPADFTSSGCGELGNTFLQARLNAMGEQGHTSDSYGLEGADGSRETLTLSMAFDESNYEIRGRRKLRFAYCATEVDIGFDEGRGVVDVQVLYHQQMAVPIAEVVFGEWATVAGRDAFYASIQRDYEMPYQLEPNYEEDTPGGWVDLGTAFSDTSADPSMYDFADDD